MDKHQTPSIISICLLLLLITGGVFARPTTPQEAMLVVSGWLAGNAEPFDVPLGNLAVDVQTVTGEVGEPMYYIVRLSPSGVAIVPADDLIEPILGFTEAQNYEPNDHDPLTALITADLNRRLADAYAAGAFGRLQAQSATETQTRWGDLISKAGLAQSDLSILGLQTVSDIRVAPFLKTRWAQGDVCSSHCYNYFTPGNNPCGCVATSMAQLLYYYRQPTTGVGQHSFTIHVLGRERSASTRGGDDVGGPYRWADMVASPDCSSTVEQRKAIGALCYDVGIAIRMSYAPDGSGADGFAIVPAFKSLFGFSNGISGANNGRNIGAALAGMVNPNLDAQYPVILGITGKSGHAVLVDGYGYDQSTRAKTIYHHVNMGWAGHEDIWYNLPAIGDYDTVPVCIYNVYVEGTGEIISGRVTDASGQPLSGVAIRADLQAKRYETMTNDKGIYALAKLPSASLFAVRADKFGFTFTKQTVATGTSLDRQASAGNKWGVDFVGTRTTKGTPADVNPAEPQPSLDSTSPEAPLTAN